MTMRNWAMALAAITTVGGAAFGAQAAPVVGFSGAAPVVDQGNAVEKATFYRQRGCWRHGHYICGYARGYGHGNSYYNYGHGSSLGLFFGNGGGRSFRSYGGNRHAFHGGGRRHHR